jgi:hypothetical protein
MRREQNTILAMITAFVATTLFLPGLISAGNLEPTNPPGSTMKTLDEVQPCRPVQSLSGDADSVYIIDEPGAYYLTGNIYGEENKRGITIADDVDNVTIDLKGFSLIGVSDSREGIFFKSNNVGAVVRNGMISSWGQTGLDAEYVSSGYFSDIISESNQGRGFELGFDCLVTKCVARDNSSFGFEAHDNCLIRDCVARHNTGAGGFCLYSGGQIIGCIAENNGYEGIRADYEAQVINCNVCFNKWGITVKMGCNVSNNNCAQNNEIGIRCGTVTSGQNRIDANHVMGAPIGIKVDSPGNIITRNSVRADTTAYDISTGNSYGPIVDVTAVGDISSVINSSHPWANFQF